LSSIVIHVKSSYKFVPMLLWGWTRFQLSIKIDKFPA
jgi:hypothetical protein